MRIVSIAQRPDLVEVVARWQFDEWERLEPGESLAGRIAGLTAQAADGDGVVATFVALDRDVPVGTASVVEQTDTVYRASPRQRDLTPWLASVYVPPECRGRGIATALVHHAVAHVTRHGVARFYLFTDGARGLYERCGWRVLGVDAYGGREMTIMAIDLRQLPQRDDEVVERPALGML